ncbi:MAG: RNA polymerase sigma factor [Deltaproteobacteria bacterium]|nr:RNA polymerase sigma factor [Deltaproteobacteria bacterium]
MTDAPSDEALLARYRRGDVEAFRALVRRHQRALYNFALRQVRTPSTAEDIVQDVFVRIVQNVETFKEESRFTTWAYTIARNLCIDHLRKRVHRRHASLDAPAGGHSDGEGEGTPLGERVAAQGAGADRAAIGRQLQGHIAAAVEALPEDQREVFLMRQVGELPFKEIAEIVGVSENTVKSRMRYALERLQGALAEFEDYAKALK